MTQARLHRPRKRQLGQFLTPPPLAAALVADLPLTAETRVLEPSFGDGSFLLPLLRRSVALHDGSPAERLRQALAKNLHGTEIDHELRTRGLRQIAAEYGPLPVEHHLVCADFFRHEFTTPLLSSLCEGRASTEPRRAGGVSPPVQYDMGHGNFTEEPGGLRPPLASIQDRGSELVRFDLIVGNPPFGGTLDPTLQDALDREFGQRGGLKIKKETYSFFLVKCVERLRPGGRLRFICSDSLLTIPTMKGLRTFLMDEGNVTITHLPEFSTETSYPMIVLDFVRNGPAAEIIKDGRRLGRPVIELSGNHSWGMSDRYARLFDGPRVGDVLVGSSGMTIGRNELFVRPIVKGAIREPYRFEFFDEPITLARELRRARLHRLSARQQEAIREQERQRMTRRNVRAVRLDEPARIELPHPDYKPYNKSNGRIVHAPPDHAIYWKDDGDAVLTFKKNGNWYLHGVGGQPFFEREGLTWALVASRFKTRYLPPGSILDSGAPCGFLRDGVPREELEFIMAWTLSPLCAAVLKSVINHTVNIQSKDLERLPYPHWVAGPTKGRIIRQMRELIARAQRGEEFTFESPELVQVGAMFEPESV